MKRRNIRKLLDELTSSVMNGRPHDLDFKPCGKLTEAQKKLLQESLDDSFRNWRDTWIIPWIEAIRIAAGVDKLKT